MTTVEWWAVQDWQLMSRVDSIFMQGSTGNELTTEIYSSSFLSFD